MSERPQKFDEPVIASPRNARVSEYNTTVAIPRHQPDPQHLLLQYDDYSPYPSSTPTAVNSRAPSPSKERGNLSTSPGPDSLLRWRLGSGFFAYFMSGWADGVTGTVMPYLSSQFNLTSTMSSSLFAASTCGFFAGTVLVEHILSYLGRIRLDHQKPARIPLLRLFTSRGSRLPPTSTGYSPTQARFLLIVLSSILYTSYFLMMGSQKGFPMMFLAYVMSAFSRSLLTAALNAFFASGPKQALGYGLGLVGLGSVVSPLVCQSLIATGVPWYRFYYGSLVVAGLNILFLSSSFKPSTAEVISERTQAVLASSLGRSNPSSSSLETEKLPKTDNSLVNDNKQNSVLLTALKMPYQWAFSCFILLYCGSETTTQGFMVSYLINAKKANPRTIGYVTSGFWGGMSAGRFIWGYITPSLTFTHRKHLIHACIGVAIVMHVLIWVVSSAIGNAVSASLIGLLYGPIFPACLIMANDILPTEVHMVVMALISSFASLGGAVFPLMTGAVLDAKGSKSLTYVTVPLALAMGVLWTFFPSRIRRPATSSDAA